MNGTRKEVAAAAFGRADGLPSFGCNAGEQNSGWTDREGTHLGSERVSVSQCWILSAW